MLYDRETRTLTLGNKPCTACYGEGTVATVLPCPTCKGTGKGPRGGARGCRSCYGNGRAYDHENRQTCTSCMGHPEDKTPENWCDSVPREAMEDMPFIVVRQDRDSSWNEQYLGMGCLWSCTDYGDAWKAGDDAALLDKVRDEACRGRVQGVKIVRDHKFDPAPMNRCTECREMFQDGDVCPDHPHADTVEEWIGTPGDAWARRFTYAHDKPSLRVADAVLIVVNRGGYSVRAAWADTLDAVLDDAAHEPGYALAMAIGGAVYRAGGNGTIAAALPIRPNVGTQ